MKGLLKTYLFLLVSLIYPFTLSAQTPLDSVAVDSILSARYPRIYPVYLDSAQIASLVDEMSSVPELYSVEYEETPISVTLDNTKAVGFIPIKSEVSPTGAKLYEIPIDVYPGMNGMTPSISLSYNSHSGRGLAGVGWSVSGISSIRRSQKTIEHNGYADGVQLNTDDAFVLDGTRLVYSSKESGYILYVSEQGNIKAKGYYNGDVTTHFDVYYPDGKKGVYGSSLFTDNNLVYPLMSMSDIKGNTISYTYIQTENNYTLSEISYNGASVLFQYEGDRPDPIGTYLGGLGMNESNLLKSIVCKFGDTVLGTYSLTHITQNHLSLLSQVDYTAGTESFNPVRFFYNSTVSNRMIFSKTNTILSGYYPFDERVDLNVVRGKFNYDVGDEGLAVYPNYPTYIKVLGLTGDYNDIEYHYFRNYYEGNEKIFIYSGIGKYITQAGQELTTEAGFVDLLIADLDGNQQEYLIKVNNRVVNGQEELTFKAYKVGIFPTPLEVYNKSFTLSTVYNGGDIEFSVQPKFYRVGDFNGDGKQEIMAVSAHQPFGDTSLPSKVYVFDIVNGKILYENQMFNYNVEFLNAYNTEDKLEQAELNTDKLFVLDYDGDGKTDVCHINGSWMTMYSFDTSGSSMTMKQVVGTTAITNSTLQNRILLFGEFNGDGLVDLLLSPTKGSSSSAYWTIYNSKGDGQFVANLFSGVSYEDDDDDDVGFITQDVNGDGISDVIKYTNIGFYVYFVNGNKFGVESGYYAFSKEKAIMLSIEVNTHNVFTQVVAFKDSHATCYSGNYDYNRESLIGGMANSLGVVERNTYRKIDASSIESGFYTKGTAAEFPYVNIVEPINMLATTETYVNSSLAEEVNYTYQNAVMNRQGLGFCGFETVTSTDNHGRTRVRNYDPMKYGIPTKEVTAEYKTTYNYTAVRNDDGTLKIRLNSKIEEDLLKGTSTPTMISYDDYGNATYISTYYPNSISKNSTNKYSNTTTATDGYYIGFLYDQVNKTHKNGNTVLEHINVPSFGSGYAYIKKRDIDGNLVETETFQYDSHGNLTTKTVTPYSSTVSHATTYEYDSYGRLVKETDPLGLSKEYLFDETGRVSCTKDIRGNSTSYAYDSFGRDTLVSYPDGTTKTTTYAWCNARAGELYSKTVTETGKPTVTTIYDALNREVRSGVTRFDGSVVYTDRAYNTKGKLEKESLPYKGDSPNYWNVYTYDSHDRVTSHTEASGRTTTYTYNGTKVTTVEDGVSVTRDYDSQGDLISVEDPAGTVTYDLCPDGKPFSITAPGDVTVTFGYDKYRRRISIDDPSHGLTTYEYDAAGNVSKETDATGKVTQYSYDRYNRLVYTDMPEMVTGYFYTGYNELYETSTEYLAGISNYFYTCYDYDNYGRLSKYTETHNNRTFYKNFEYSDGNISSVKYYDQSTLLATESYVYKNTRWLN